MSIIVGFIRLNLLLKNDLFECLSFLSLLNNAPSGHCNCNCSNNLIIVVKYFDFSQIITKYLCNFKSLVFRKEK